MWSWVVRAGPGGKGRSRDPGDGGALRPGPAWRDRGRTGRGRRHRPASTTGSPGAIRARPPPSVGVVRSSLIELAEAATPDAVVTATHRGEPAVVRAITFFTQALDHGCEHRTQVRHSLTILGCDPPDIDGWAYDEEVQEPLPG